MDLNDILISIKQKLNSSENPVDKAHVEKLRLLNQLGSASEIIGEIGLYLQGLKTNDPRAYQLIEKEIDTYMKFCREQYQMFLD